MSLSARTNQRGFQQRSAAGLAGRKRHEKSIATDARYPSPEHFSFDLHLDHNTGRIAFVRRSIKMFEKVSKTHAMNTNPATSGLAV
jgi:hypothetical protein